MTKEMDEKKIIEIVNRLKNIEGSHKFNETLFIVAPKNKIKLYFTAHMTTARYVFFNYSGYLETNINFLCPRFIDEIMTEKYMIDIINYLSSRGRHQ